ncbi:hypothetical protein ASD11_14185 [Aeromicrobium sp. Root495]|nr:hypothetical protein ASD11_14185 [Aeromicrobium sp. Root495]
MAGPAAFLALTTLTAASTLVGVPAIGVAHDGTLSSVIIGDHSDNTATSFIAWEALSPTQSDTEVTTTQIRSQAPAARTSQNEVLWVKEQSGLTWDQLGKVFGVSRRAVHLWANGGRVNAANERALRNFAAAVAAAKGETPDATRAALLSPGEDGRSILSAFQRDRVAANGLPWGEPFTAEEKAGAGKEGAATDA